MSMTKNTILAGTLVLVSAGAIVAQQRFRPEQVYRQPKLEVVLPDFPAEGLILDVGGGGEGIIEQLKGKQVVAIDLSKRELEETPPSADPLLKIVMDARDLKFVDQSFATATVFFTFMYMDPADHEKVFQELNRVLKPGGRLLIWDVVFPAKKEPAHEVIMYPVHVRLPKSDVNTGYGVFFHLGQGADHFVELAAKTGFQAVSRKDEGGWFMLEMRKGS